MQQTITLEQYQALKLKYTALDRQLRWIRHLAKNPDLSPADKWCVLARIWKAEDTQQPLDTPIPMCFEEDHEMIGMSAREMGRRYKILAENGLLIRLTGHTGVGEDNIKTHVSIGLAEQLLKRPDKVFFKEERNHGGKRVFCPSCGCGDIEVVRYKTCKGCGTVFDKERADIEDQQTEPLPPIEQPILSPMKLPVKRDEKPPSWLIPGTYDWNKQVERHGSAEMYERRKAWFQQQGGQS